MNLSADKSAILAREERLARPIGICAILAALLIQAGVIISATASQGDTFAENLLDLAADSGARDQYLLGTIIVALGFLALIPAVVHLLFAAIARSERVSRTFTGFVIIGGLLIAAGSIAKSAPYIQGAKDFGHSEASRTAAPVDVKGSADGAAQPEAKGTTQVAANGAAKGTVKEPEATGTTETSEASTTAGSTNAAGTGETSTESAGQSADESRQDAEDEADDRARNAIDDAGGAVLAGALTQGGALMLGIGIFYTSLWAMRTGLLSRFWGSFGMAASVLLALLFLFVFIQAWAIALGMVIAGLWPGGRPPAWDAGVARPWPTRASVLADLERERTRDEELVEAGLPPEDDDASGGSGAPGDPSVPEHSGAPEGPHAPDDPYGEATGADGPQLPPPRKRKRRR